MDIKQTKHLIYEAEHELQFGAYGVESRSVESISHTSLNTNQIVRDLVAGIVSNCVGIIIGHPLDTIKIRMQLSETKLSTTNMLVQILRHEGAFGLFKGVCSPVMGQTPIRTAGFVANDYAKRSLGNSQFSEHSKNLLSGMLSGLVWASITTPFDCLKIKKQGNATKDLSYFKIIQSEGVSGLFKGLSVTVVRDVPGWCSYFYSYTWLKRLFESYTSNDDAQRKSFWTRFFAGGLAGQISWFVAYPADVVKSNVQYNSSSPSKLKMIVELYKAHGVGYFFRGLSPWLIRAFPVNSTVFVLYEHLLEVLNDAGFAE